MFIDENVKNNYTTSDTMYNVVYEGNLRNLTHKEILGLIIEIISYFICANEIYVYKEELIDNSNTYKKYSYRIDVVSDFVERKEGIYNNIVINTRHLHSK